MKLFDRMTQFEGFELSWHRLFIQGLLTMLIGMFLALASAINPGAIVLAAREHSWLPASGFFIFILGLFECVDSFLAKEQRDVVQNLQVGVLDVVIGGLLIVSVSGSIARISMMVSAFLLVRGIVRIIFVFILKLPNWVSTAMGGGLSIILGALLYLWPEAEGWFISLCLNIEIAFRGWAGISFAFWVKNQQQNDT